jgi:hypothetical protein
MIIGSRDIGEVYNIAFSNDDTVQDERERCLMTMGITWMT